MDYEQLPSRSYPARSKPGQSLAHGGAATLGMSYPDGEQLPKRAYPLGSQPLHHLARIQGGTGLGLTYPDSEQCPKRGYPLGSHPLRHLARCNGTEPALSGGGSFSDNFAHYRQPFDPIAADDEEVLELVMMTLRYYL